MEECFVDSPPSRTWFSNERGGKQHLSPAFIASEGCKHSLNFWVLVFVWRENTTRWGHRATTVLPQHDAYILNKLMHASGSQQLTVNQQNHPDKAQESNIQKDCSQGRNKMSLLDHYLQYKGKGTFQILLKMPSEGQILSPLAFRITWSYLQSRTDTLGILHYSLFGF